MARLSNCPKCGRPKEVSHKCLKRDRLPTLEEIKEAERKAKKKEEKEFMRGVGIEVEAWKLELKKIRELKAADIKERREFRLYNKQKAVATIQRLEDKAFTWKGVDGKTQKVEKIFSVAERLEKRRRVESKRGEMIDNDEGEEQWQLIENLILAGLKFPPDMQRVDEMFGWVIGQKLAAEWEKIVDEFYIQQKRKENAKTYQKRKAGSHRFGRTNFLRSH